jgi:hypothetical protein
MFYRDTSGLIGVLTRSEMGQHLRELKPEYNLYVGDPCVVDKMRCDYDDIYEHFTMSSNNKNIVRLTSIIFLLLAYYILNM